MSRQLVLALLALLAAALLAPAAAPASSAQVMTFEAPGELLDDSEREATLDEIQSFGVKRVRALVYWRDFSARPNSKRPPSFDRADPDAYPAGTWDRLDRLVDSTERRGIELQVTLTGPVPTWATKTRRGHLNTPSAAEFGRWAKAVATRYGDRVDLWSIWNEPNHPEFLKPQYSRRPAGLAEDLPRAVSRRASGRSTASGAARATRCCSARPRRSATRTSSRRWCSCARPRAWTRATTKARSCAKLRLDGYAHHAYTRKQGPNFRHPDADDVSIGALDRLVAALDKVARTGAIARHMPIYLTEFGIQSKPDPIAGVSLRRQAEFLAIAERIAYANPRVAAFSQYLMVDDQPRSGLAAAALLRLRDRAEDVERPQEARLRRVHPAARRQAVRRERRALGPRAPGDGADRGHDPAQGRQRRLEAPDRRADERRLRLPRRPPVQPALSREVEAPRRRHDHRPADPGLTENGAAAALPTAGGLRSNLPASWRTSSSGSCATARPCRTNPSPTSSAS